MENMNTSLTDIAAKSLGSANSYAVYTSEHDASLLNPMPRDLGRKDWKIDASKMVGFDRWNCHEATFMTNSGLPIAGTLSFVYPSSSEFMVESKSAKLYLNSFDMEQLGETKEEAIAKYEACVKTDLENIIQADVDVHFFSADEYEYANCIDLKWKLAAEFLETYLSDSVTFNDFTGQGSYVKSAENNNCSWFTNVLRSRCRHTKQKDTGSAIIRGTDIDPETLMRQIVSLRDVAEFHELCAEKLFQEISKAQPECAVYLLYSRRGSLDINPVRASSIELIDSQFINPAYYMLKQQSQ